MKASWGMSFACIGIQISSLSHVILLHQTANLFLVPYQMVLLQLECWTGESQGLLMVLELGHVIIRQHVNPLSSSNIVPVQVPDWNEVYKNPTLPLMVNIGCERNKWRGLL
ncbi:hypothetical protein LWI28_016727 [Acer negundo]|uniref:Uncharacterized protein n=1 Tax=Acer negundo TaxID=4023 RepID=A0AAD5NUU9_ACENE|nr:hypothetical protein LWI28_016727 [Acer negundo]